MMGRGWMILRVSFHAKRISKYLMLSIFSLLTIVSLTVLSIDYWLVESNQVKIWMPLASQIRNEVQAESKIVSVTGADPTLLNLARRQGWLITGNDINAANVNDWINHGATHIAGSLNWKETYNQLEINERKKIASKIQCQERNSLCLKPPNYTYLVRLSEVMN